jgi:predicted PurR-regulated permease PerM
MGAKLAGVIGALGAIPIAGAIQVVVVDWLAQRRHRIGDRVLHPGATGSPP